MFLTVYYFLLLSDINILEIIYVLLLKKKNTFILELIYFLFHFRGKIYFIS